MLNGLAEKYDLRVEKIDISSSDCLYALYRFDIPVFKFRDSTTLHSRIKKKELLERLEANGNSKMQGRVANRLCINHFGLNVLQQVPHFFLFGLQVKYVFLVRLSLYGNPLYDL